MVLVDGNGTPLGIHVDSASPAEVKLLKTTMDNVSVGGKRGRPRSKPERLILDRAYDSNPERKRLDSLGVEPIIPARRNNKKATLKTAENCAVIDDAGSLSGRIHGYKTSDDS
ncbi:MAG: transposase [Bdellovibrionales bacterium]|nr:transposase [Bdellovibrionales bacterium]